MEILKVIDPSTILGAFSINVVAGLAVSFILGFFTGKKVERRKATAITIGRKNTVIQNTKFGK